MKKNFITKGTSLSTAHYNINENIYYYVAIIAIPFIVGIVASFLTIYFGESLFIKHNIISTYFDNLFSFGKTVNWNGDLYPKAEFNAFAEAAFEKKNIWTIFYTLIGIYYVGLFYPIYKVINWFIKRVEDKMQDEHIRGSIVLEDKEYAEIQKKEHKDNGILLSFVYDFKSGGEDKAVGTTIKQFKNGEVQNVQI